MCFYSILLDWCNQPICKGWKSGYITLVRFLGYHSVADSYTWYSCSLCAQRCISACGRVIWVFELSGIWATYFLCQPWHHGMGEGHGMDEGGFKTHLFWGCVEYLLLCCSALPFVGSYYQLLILELETTMLLVSYDLVAITEAWWDGYRDWSVAMDGYRLIRKGQARKQRWRCCPLREEMDRLWRVASEE